MRAALFLLFTLAVSSNVEQQADVDTETKLLQGTWKVSSLEVDGKVQPAEKAPKEFIIAGKTLKGIGPEMTIKLDPSKKPKWIDLIFKKGDKDFPIKAIYEVVGDELKLCMPLAVPGKEFANQRPERFESGKTEALFKAKRVGKQP